MCFTLFWSQFERLSPSADAFLGVRLERRDDIHPVQGRQMVKMHDVVMDAMGRHDQIPYELGVQRDFELQGVLNRPHRGQCVNGRSNPAVCAG